MYGAHTERSRFAHPHAHERRGEPAGIECAREAKSGGNDSSARSACDRRNVRRAERAAPSRDVVDSAWASSGPRFEGRKVEGRIGVGNRLPKPPHHAALDAKSVRRPGRLRQRERGGDPLAHLAPHRHLAARDLGEIAGDGGRRGTVDELPLQGRPAHRIGDWRTAGKSRGTPRSRTGAARRAAWKRAAPARIARNWHGERRRCHTIGETRRASRLARGLQSRERQEDGVRPRILHGLHAVNSALDRGRPRRSGIAARPYRCRPALVAPSCARRRSSAAGPTRWHRTGFARCSSRRSHTRSELLRLDRCRRSFRRARQQAFAGLELVVHVMHRARSRPPPEPFALRFTSR